jgi:predicted AAA+ superfamily ATPase
MIKRSIESSVLSDFNSRKVIIITGSRQTGKTTLAGEIARRSGLKYKWFNADEPDVRSWFTDPTSTVLKQLFGDASLVVIDEAQRIVNIGITLKLAVENIPAVQVIATGSSALELTGNINEPLTGRKREYVLYPFSFQELARNTTKIEERRLLERRMIFGLYPEVVNNPGKEEEILNSLTDSYLFKDILSLEKIRKPALLEKIILALALQTGSEVSFNEIGRMVGADNQTVERYIDLLRKVYVVFSLSSFSRNLRNELKKSTKIYFWDNGIRNTLIKNFNPLSLRNDTGALWENYLMTERMKYLHYSMKYVNSYFWRTSQQQEIDYVEIRDGIIHAFEFQWSQKERLRVPKTFLSAYPESTFEIITRDNYTDFLT